MLSRVVRAVLVALVAGTLVLAGTAEYAPPGPKRIVTSVSR